MNVSVKDVTSREVPIMEYTKQNDPFMYLRAGAWGPTLDLLIGNHAINAARAAEVCLGLKQKVQKSKEVAPAKLKGKGKGKEKAPSKAKSKRKTKESLAEGAPKKKLLALAIQAAKRVEVQCSYLLL